MRRIISEVFMKCDSINSENDLLFKREEISQYDWEIDQKIKIFAKRIEDVKLQQQFKELCEAINDLNICRDREVSKLFIVHGMALYMQLQNEILTT